MSAVRWTILSAVLFVTYIGIGALALDDIGLAETGDNIQRKPKENIAHTKGTQEDTRVHRLMADSTRLEECEGNEWSGKNNARLQSAALVRAYVAL